MSSLPRYPIVAGLVLALASACSGGVSAVPDDASGGEAEQDAVPDHAADPAHDPAEDLVPDLVPDVGQDEAADPAPDVALDVASDTAPDPAPETGDVTGPEEDAQDEEPADVAAETPVDATELPPAVCAKDFDCDDGDPCTIDTCHAKTGECTHAANACSPGRPCFAGACLPGAGCKFVPLFQADCFSPPAKLASDFEGGLGGWTVEDLAQNVTAGEPIVWAPTSARAHSGTRSVRFGDPASMTFANGRKVAATMWTAVSPSAFPPGSPVRLVFWVWADVEDGDLWDVLSVAISCPGFGSVPLWSKGYGFPMKAWTPIEIDLSAFFTPAAGGECRLDIAFNSVDDSMNDGEGVYVDDVWLVALATVPACASDADCDDHVACTTDACADHACTHGIGQACCTADVECDDFDACTHDLCQGGGCQHVAVADPECCNADPDCDDANDCTTDACAKNLCKHTVVGAAGCCTADFECNDDDKCTKDSCQAFHCAHINTCCQSDDECDDLDDVCTNDHCTDGRCVFQPTGAPGCCANDIGGWTFDDGAVDGWKFSAKTEGVGWQVTTAGEAASDPGALYYGNVSTWNYKTNAWYTYGTATSGEIDLPPDLPITLTFKVAMMTAYSYEDLYAYVLSEGLADISVYSTWDSFNSFKTVTVDLSAWAGRKVRVQFEFDAWDGGWYGGKGVFVDDVLFTTTCQPRTCQTNPDCNDKLYDTTDTCKDGVCAYAFGGMVK
jgi:hypothetical protein